MIRIIKVTDLLFVGGNGHIQAIDCFDSNPIPLWHTKLFAASGIVSISWLVGVSYLLTFSELDKVYAACSNYIFCIEASTGIINWSHKLSKSAYGTPSIIPFGNFIIAGVSGFVIALLKDSGNEVWTTNLKGWRCF